MYIMYVDESGDPAPFMGSNSNHYILSGLIIHSSTWNTCFDSIKNLRRDFKNRFMLNIREELHASELIRINKIRSYAKIKKADRIRILEETMLNIPVIFSNAHLINVCLDKSELAMIKNFQEVAWDRLINRYDRFLKGNLASGIIISDGSIPKQINAMFRKMRIYNPISSKFQSTSGGSYNATTNNIIEDILPKDSHQSYFIQMADCISHCLYRKEYPKGSLKKRRVHTFFDSLQPILLLKASSKDPQGFVKN